MLVEEWDGDRLIIISAFWDAALQAKQIGLAERITRQTVGETTSDNYGDFKLDKLDEDSGSYVIEISAPARY